MAFCNHYSVTFCGKGYMLQSKNPCLIEYTGKRPFNNLKDLNAFIKANHRGRSVPIVHMPAYNPRYFKTQIKRIVAQEGGRYIGDK